MSTAASAWNYLDLLYFTINRCSQESGLLLRPTHAVDRFVSSYCSSAYYDLHMIGRVRQLLTRDACHVAVPVLFLVVLIYATDYRWIEQWTIQPPSTSAELGRTTYQPRQTMRTYYTNSAITTLAADQDASNLQDMHVHIQDHAWLSPRRSQLCGSVLRAHMRFTTSM